ncbi:MAG: hypothetical protein ACD_5C00206G0008 [uncultured bacterium]|nr:MAG: hypothetical protein ACD_5C00206G0008 [uncultured bacterium]
MFDLNPHQNFKEIGFILSSIKGTSYFGIFILSIFVSFIVPLPEAVALVLFGFIGATTELNIFVIFSVAFMGLILGDNLLYRLSFLGNDFVKRFDRKMRKNKLIKYENMVVDNVFKTIYFLRLVAGVRFFGPVIAGTLGVSWKKFFPANIGATFLNTVIFVALGYFLHNRVISLLAEVEIVRNILLLSSAVIVGFLISIFSQKKA